MGKLNYDGSWYQEDYEYVKENISDEFDFHGSGGRSEISLKFDVGNQMEVGELKEKGRKLQEELENADMNVEKVVARVGYRGATNTALFLVAYFEEPVYE